MHKPPPPILYTILHCFSPQSRVPIKLGRNLSLISLLSCVSSRYCFLISTYMAQSSYLRSHYPPPFNIVCIHFPVYLMQLLYLVIPYLYHLCHYFPTSLLPHCDCRTYLPTTTIFLFSLLCVFDAAAPHHLISPSCNLRRLMSSSFLISAVSVLPYLPIPFNFPAASITGIIRP